MKTNDYGIGVSCLFFVALVVLLAAALVNHAKHLLALRMFRDALRVCAVFVSSGRLAITGVTINLYTRVKLHDSNVHLR